MDGYVLTLERLIRASPEAIFDVLADPAKHALIDGSGMVQGTSGAPSTRLALGTTFGMSMKLGMRYSTASTVVEFEENPARLSLGATFAMSMKLGPVPYKVTNRVVEFETNRRIAWQTGPKGRLGAYVAGRIWRYELEPVEGGTLVHETWDITPDHQRVLLKLGDIWSGKVRRDMELTLARLDALVTAPA